MTSTDARPVDAAGDSATSDTGPQPAAAGGRKNLPRGKRVTSADYLALPKKATGRLPVKSQLDDDELEASIEGSAREWARRVLQAGQSLGMTRAQVAESIGVTPGYLNTLLARVRQSDESPRKSVVVGRETLRRSAQLMGVPTIAAELLCGTLKPEDLFSEAQHEEETRRAYIAMLNNNNYAAFVPSSDEWNSLSLRSRYFVALMYELATAQQIMNKMRLLVNSAPPKTPKNARPASPADEADGRSEE